MIKRIFSLSTFLCLMAMSAMAQDRPWYLGAMGTATHNFWRESDTNVPSSNRFEMQLGRLSVGRYLSNAWAIEAAYSRGESEWQNSVLAERNGGGKYFQSMEVNAQYHWLKGRSAWDPYATAGMGMLQVPTYGTTWKPYGMVGAGMDYWMGERLALGALVTYNGANGDGDNYLQYSMGLKYRFGKKKQAAPTVDDRIAIPVQPAQPEPKQEPKQEPVQQTAPAPEPAPAPAPVVRTIEEVLFFGFNETNLSPDARKQLQDIAQKLKGNKVKQVVIEGHTDNIGSAEVNKRVAMARALSVKRQLMALGVDESQIVLKSQGFVAPLGDNKTAAGRAQNRRAQVVVTLQ